MHMHTHTCTHIDKNVSAYAADTECTEIRCNHLMDVCMRVHIYTYVRVCIYVCIHIFKHKLGQIYTLEVQRYMHISTHRTNSSMQTQCLAHETHTNVYIHIYIYIYLHAIYICYIHIYENAFIHTFTHACMNDVIQPMILLTLAHPSQPEPEYFPASHCSRTSSEYHA
jgi:hypothetical protein